MLNFLKDKGPVVMLQAFDTDCETPELIWNASLREELNIAVTEQLDPIVCDGLERKSLESFALDSMFSVNYESLKTELYVGGVYVRQFIKDPSFHLKDPTGFLEVLLATWSQSIDSLAEEKNELSKNSLYESSMEDTSLDMLKDVTNACILLCNHSYLCVKLAPWGYVKYAIVLLHRLITKGFVHYPLLSIFKILHIASTERVNVEEILKTCDGGLENGIVDGIMKSVGSVRLHPHSDFILETLKNITKDALGEVEKNEINLNKSFFQRETQDLLHSSLNSQIVDLGPSPAPGMEPVKKMEKLAGGDPLSMLLGNEDSSPSPRRTQHPVKPIRSQRKTPNITNTGMLKQSQPKRVNAEAPKVTTRVNPQHGVRNTSHNTVKNQAHTTTHGNIQNRMTNQPTKTPTQMQVTPSDTNNPNTSKQTHSNSRLNSFKSTLPNQYKYPVPTGRGVQPLRNKSRAQSSPLQNPSLQFQRNTSNATKIPIVTNMNMQRHGQNIHPPQNLNNHANSSSNQAGLDPPRKSSGILSKEERNIGTPLPNLSTQTSNPNVNHNYTYHMTGSYQSNYKPPNSQEYVAGAEKNTNGLYTQPQKYFSSNGYQVPQPFQDSGMRPSSTNIPGQLNPQHSVLEATPHQSTQFYNAETTVQSSTPITTDLSHQNGQRFALEATPHGSTQFYNSETTVQSSAPITTDLSHQNGQSETYDKISNEQSLADPKIIAEQRMKSSSGSPGSAFGRGPFLSSVLRCGLIHFLVNDVLENTSLENVNDPEAVKLHTLEIINLLSMDPGYGLMFRLILDSIPQWEKYE